MTTTLEQQRAQDAWECSQDCTSEYKNLAKGLPALIMNSGLMQVMAFLHEKSDGGSGRKNPHCADLAKQLRHWLSQRFAEIPEPFEDFMQALMKADSATYQAVTAEAYAWLRWVRQMAAAACP